jgi:hypothetical protein
MAGCRIGRGAEMAETAMVTKAGVLDMQVCVPTEWADEKVREFAERNYPCGTTNGWHIRREGDRLLSGSAERVDCGVRSGFVHIMLDA